MSAAQAIAERLRAAAPHATLPPASVCFDLGDDGSITVNGRVVPASVTADADAAADCTIRIAAPHLLLILDGRVSVGAGFMKFVRASAGDIDLTMRIQRLLRAAVARPVAAA